MDHSLEDHSANDQQRELPAAIPGVMLPTSPTPPTSAPSQMPRPPYPTPPQTLAPNVSMTTTTPPTPSQRSATAQPSDCMRSPAGGAKFPIRHNTVTTVNLHGVSIVCLFIDGQERLCLAQISNTLLKQYSYNEIHNRRVALGITCVQCTPVQLEILRRAGAMPISSRRCGMITKREAERLVKSFLEDTTPPKLPENFAFSVKHNCGWSCQGCFIPSRYNSSRAKCIKCTYCNMFFSPNKFIFHFHRHPDAKYSHPDAANFNSWRRHLKLADDNASDDLAHAWEDVKAMFNGGSRKRVLSSHSHSHSHSSSHHSQHSSSKPGSSPAHGCFKRPKTDPESNHPQGIHPHAGGTPYPQYPVFPVPSKLMKTPGAPPPPPQPPQSHPAFGMPYTTGFEKSLPQDHPGGMKPSPGGNWGQESLYPPYEMIWAKHLGLSAAAEASMPHGFPRLSPSRPGFPDPAKFPAPLDTARFRRHDVIDLHAKEERGLLRTSPHTSAFTPVGKGPDTGGVNSPTQEPDAGHDSPVFVQPDQASDDGYDARDRSEYDSDSEPLDVDTIDDEDDVTDPSLTRNEENNNQVLGEKDDQEESCVEEHVRENCLEIDECTSNGNPDLGRNEELLPRSDCAQNCDYRMGDAGERTSSSPMDEDSCHAPSTPGASPTPQPDDQKPVAGIPNLPCSPAPVDNMTKDDLLRQLIAEMESRKKVENDCISIRESFKEEVDREKQCKEEMGRQLQLVKDTLCNELDQERRARFTLQQKLKEAHDALHNFSCKMLTATRQCSECSTYKEPILPR